jgi:hypothetical protein
MLTGKNTSGFSCLASEFNSLPVFILYPITFDSKRLIVPKRPSKPDNSCK